MDLFHDFLGKLDERFSVLESAINQMPSHGKEREQAHQDGGSGETAKSVIVPSESNGTPLDEESSHHPAKIRRYDNCINTNSSFSLPAREDQASFMGLYKIDPEPEERALFGSRSNYSDESSGHFSVTYGNNSPCTEQGRAKSFVDSSKNPVCTGTQSPPVLTSGGLRPRATFPSSSTVQPELPCLAQVNVSEDPLPVIKDSDIYFDHVNNSDDNLVFQLDDDIKDFYCRYRDIRLSKDTLVNIKKDLPVPQIDFLSPPKVREAIEASKSFSSNKGIEINDYKLSKIQDQSSLAAYRLLHLWQNIGHSQVD